MASYNKAIMCLCHGPAEYHCNTCGDTLCANCKKTHLKSRATGHHSVVDYAAKVMPCNVPSPLCSTHQETECTYWCEECGKAACFKCVTSTHQNHKLAELDFILKGKRDVVQKQLEILESKSLKEIDALLKHTQQTTKEYLEGVNRTDVVLDLRATVFHQKVDVILQQSKNQLQDLKATGLAILDGHEKEITDILWEIKENIKECEDTLRNGDMERLMRYEVSQDKERSDLPDIQRVLPPIFTPGKIDEAFTKMFGSLTTMSIVDTVAYQSKEQSNLNRTDFQRFSGPEAQQKPSIQKESQEQDTFATPTIICLGSDRAWVERQNRLELVNPAGVVMDSIDTDFYFSDVALSANRELLLTDSTNDCVKSISPSRMVKTLFTTPFKPWGICCLPSGDILVTFLDDGGAVIYNTYGKEVQRVSKTQLKHPYKVAVNRVNNNICIIDKDDVYIKSPGKVVAFGRSFIQKYQYSGQQAQFYPIDLCTDRQGNVLITDFNSNTIHILDKDGGVSLKYFITKGIPALFKEKAYGIDVDSNGKMWVVEWKGAVRTQKLSIIELQVICKFRF